MKYFPSFKYIRGKLCLKYIFIRRKYMARSEFRWNKKRKHYAYLHKDRGSKRKNILITSKPIMIEKKNKGTKRIKRGKKTKENK